MDISEVWIRARGIYTESRRGLGFQGT